MLVTNRHRQRIAAGTLDKFRRLVRIGIVITRQRFFVHRFIAHMAQLSFDRHTQRMEKIHGLFCQTNILFEIKGRGITHQRIHTMSPGVMDNLHATSVIPVGNNWNRGLFSH